MVNATRYGLVAYLWTRDQQRVLRGYQALRAGTVLVNSAMLTELNAPFGGVGESGVGSEGGDLSLRFYSQVKTVVLAHDWQPRRPMAGGLHIGGQTLVVDGCTASRQDAVADPGCLYICR